jgi:acyl transferase domain-containing protein/NAD(P)H-dependent flavin oxidoreductase YrpB (nitropropane dioxygenase family)/NAD(P)-dependent dehydrogenase (short-subunit alcohol dehydrogenase family)
LRTVSIVPSARGGIEAGLRAPSVLALSPLERPDPGLVAAACEAGALGVLDLGRDPARARHALDILAGRVAAFGVRVPDASLDIELPSAAAVVVVGSPADVARFSSRIVLAQVTSLDEARAAILAGAAGLIAKGCEAGGRIGEETTFVLVQHLVAELRVPVWAQGGIGLHTAAACLAGGAAGVVLDTQLALLRESSLPAEVQAAIGAMDGSETTVLDGHRVYTRPDLPVAQAIARGKAAPDRLIASGAGEAGALDASKLGGDDLRGLLPVGQDGALAKPLAQQFGTVGQLVRGVRAAITGHLATAAEVQPLAPNAPLARAHGLHYPIAQGPMSRVSDRARFAYAVARAGGLPFLALTLMTGDEVRALLRETRELLGDRPWGVGILGFVPQDVRDQQLAVLREIPPPVALIAGGRPSQAHPLEEQGTQTYLHVPSPGLLDLFLKDGARKFVFEGRECGGHVGPRSSFALWEAQLARLLAHPEPSELHVLFAGGIHDARSAAMVAAMAAPLAARGAKIGVLMGTAYVFTEEAVAAGAIQAGFQQAAIACERTVLLETAPGHATRCADTVFADQFAAEKRRLEAAGLPAQDVWAQLEQLNLGRLRIAAKGLRRDGAQIVEIDADAQQREGMYMIGQVAALRRGTCTVAELHKDVGERGAEIVAAAAERYQPDDEHSRGTDIAIVGIAAIFPGAPDTEAFWSNIVAGKNAVREVPPERWDVATYYDPAATGAAAGRKTPCKWGGFLDDIPFDPLAYGIPPKSLAAIEPVQLLSLEIARRALADAGYADRPFDREHTAVIFGAEAGTDLSSAYSFRALFPHYVGPLPATLDEALPTLSEDSFPGVLSNVIAGRIANRLDLGGVNYTVDAACAASIAAVDMAVKELVSGSAEMVLCGGADLHNSINDYLMFASVHALSPTGQCHTFDAKADGIVLGEGVACVVLKRLADAERDGDRVYAVIKGVGGASDGKSLGLTAPRKDGQVRALERAYRQAGVSPAEVGLVEAHGTGTIVGDRTELQTLTDVFARAGAAPGGVVLGSVKSQIGHTKCAAGMAGLIKSALAIYHGVLPPTLNIEAPNPAWDGSTSPFVFLDRARPWVAEQRVAAVSAFGFGGTNFHAVLAQHRETASQATVAWPAELLLFRAPDRAGAVAAVERLQQLIAADRGPGAPRLRDVARSVSAMGQGPVQLAIIADDLEDLRGKLAHAREGRGDTRGVLFAGEPAGGRVAFLCPGQGSQKVGMLGELFVAFPRLRRLLELGEAWAPKIFPPAAFGKAQRAEQAAALTDTRVAQPALGIADLAVVELLRSLGVQPDMAAGHSYGELAALCLAGALREADLLPLSAARGEAILAAAGGDPGTMAAVAADPGAVAPLVAAFSVVIANVNSPKQCVLSGPTSAVDAAIEALGKAGLTARKIPVACAFHSPVVAAASEALARRLAAIDVAAPRIPVFSNTTAEPYPSDADGVRALLADQVARPVRFAEEIEAMYAAGARVFVETGPGQVLSRLVGEILGDRPHVAVACDAGDAGLRQLLRAVGTLAVAGVPVDPAALFWDRDAALVELDPGRRVAKKSAWLVNGHVVRPADGTPAPRPSPSALVVGPAAIASAPVAAAPVAVMGAPAEPGGREGAVVEYLRTMRQMIAAQRDVMLAYLGQAPAATTQFIDVVPAAIAAAPAAAPAAPAAPAPEPTAVDPLQLVLSIVSERTGYPVETLGMDLDLEADLSIDSIKRIEIVGELAQRLGLAVGTGKESDAMVEELATRKTLRALVAWLSERIAAPAAAPVEASDGDATVRVPRIGAAAVTAGAAAVTAGAAAVTAGAAEGAAPVGRYRLAIVDAPRPLNGHTRFAGRRFAVAGADPLAGAVAARLAAEGCQLEPGTPIDGLIDASLLGPAPDPVAALRALYERARDAAAAGARHLVVATACGPFGGRSGGVGGAAGLVKTLALEWPELTARVVDVDPKLDAAVLGALLVSELHATDPHVEIGYAGDKRQTLEVIEAPRAAEAPTALGAGDVVLITGGARGITALAAVALAKRGCTIELVGRSPEPGPEDPAFAGAGDAIALRRILLERAGAVVEPAAIEQKCTRILADREIRATLSQIRAAGAPVAYHAVDVRTPVFGTLIDELYRRHGRLDAAIHGAGILDDKLARHKTVDSFERVVATKLGGAATLAAHLRDDVRLVALFSSISGVFGNRGQVDYAAASDALDRMASALRRRIAGRVVSIDWGPWAGAGMVSPALAREYARRGIPLIAPDAGVAELLAELLAGPGDDTQVILSAADPRALAARPPAAPDTGDGVAHRGTAEA